MEAPRLINSHNVQLPVFFNCNVCVQDPGQQPPCYFFFSPILSHNQVCLAPLRQRLGWLVKDSSCSGYVHSMRSLCIHITPPTSSSLPQPFCYRDTEGRTVMLYQNNHLTGIPVLGISRSIVIQISGRWIPLFRNQTWSSLHSSNQANSAPPCNTH